MDSDPRELPIYEVEADFLRAAEPGARIILQAPTGSGKSTQVPQMLDRAGRLAAGQVAILQPRRIAARMLARRVAGEMKATLGADVGYQVRLESKISDQTRIRFATEGILLRQMVDDAELRGVVAIIFDEFHERHLYGDITLGRALQLQRSARPDLLIVVMSATLETGRLGDYLAPCQTIVSAGRTFPVEIRFASRAFDFKRMSVWSAAADAVGSALKENLPGDVLVFMPGAFEINRTAEAIRAIVRTGDFAVLPLHGELPPAEQDRAVAESDRRKIIVATNVAETSLTIPGVRIVVDSGLARIARYDPHRGIDTLLVEKISQAAAEQRAGRAGRTAPGVCLRLWTERDHGQRAAAEQPEIRRRDLAEVLLTLKAAGIEDIHAFPWLEAPEAKAVEHAAELLCDLGATEAGSGRITELGRRMLSFPVHPRYARMLLEADRNQCVRSIALITALTQGRPLLLRNPGRDVEKGREDVLGRESESDLLQALEALRYAEQNRFSVENCRRIGIHAQTARQALPLAGQFLEIAARQGLNLDEQNDVRPAIRRCILAGFADRVARRADTGTLRCHLVHGRRGMLARESVVQRSPLLVAAEINEIGGRGREVTTLLSLCTAIDESLLAEVFPDDVRDETVALIDPATKRVVGRNRRVFRDLVIGEREGGDPGNEAATRLLVQEILAGRARLPQWDDAVEHWIVRVNVLAAAFPEYGSQPITEDDRPLLLEQLCAGARSFKELRERPLRPVLHSWLTPEQFAALDQMLPETLTLPNGRRGRLTYARDGTATLTARIQELYDLPARFSIADRRIPLRFEILAPNHRPIQVTDNLQRFWEVTYPEIKPALSRRYPKHEWR